MKPLILSLCVIFMSFTSQAQSCVKNSDLLIDGPNTQRFPLFWIDHRHEAIVMVATMDPETQQAMFNLQFCQSSQTHNGRFDPRKGFKFSADECETLSPNWLPMPEPDGTSQASFDNFEENLRAELERRFDLYKIDDRIAYAAAATNMIMNGMVGFMIAYVPKWQRHAVKLAKNSRKYHARKKGHGRIRRNLPTYGRVRTIFGIGVGATLAFGGWLDFANPFYAANEENMTRAEEMKQLIEAMDRDIALQFDGTDELTQVHTSIHLLKDAMQTAATETNTQICLAGSESN